MNKKSFVLYRGLKVRGLSVRWFLSLLILAAFPAWGQNVPFDVSYSVDWVRGEIRSELSFDLAQTGIRLPTGRFLAEEILLDAYPELLRPILLSLRLDSNSTVGNLAERGELSLAQMDSICLEAEKTPPSLSQDLKRMMGRYTLFINRISAIFTRHRQAIEPQRPLIRAQTADYSGIIIIADSELPVHGRMGQALVEPCIFPKIWDTDMNLVYERNMLDPESVTGNRMVRYTAREGIFRPTPSGLEGELAALLGPNPIRILAREVFGVNPTDLVIDREDALKILSSENNRRLLMEGRVALVLNETKLKRGE
jgi:hypothetical protein